MKNRNKGLFFVLIIFTLILTSCTTFKATDLAVLKNDTVSMKMLGHFEREVMVPEFLGVPGGANLLNLSADAMNQVIQDVVWSEISAKGGNGAINVNIEYNAKIIDMLAAYFTIDIFSPAHLIVSGDVILYE